jgi:hypothetical protein
MSGVVGLDEQLDADLVVCYLDNNISVKELPETLFIT